MLVIFCYLSHRSGDGLLTPENGHNVHTLSTSLVLIACVVLHVCICYSGKKALVSPALLEQEAVLGAYPRATPAAPAAQRGLAKWLEGGERLGNWTSHCM